MKITIKKDQIVKGLQAVQGVVNAGAHIPVITNVLLKATGKKLEITATDLDVTITCAVEADVKSQGSTTVSAKKLFGIVREMNAADIEIESDESHVCAVRSGKSLYRINGLSADEFPPLPKLDKAKTVKIDQSELGQMVNRTSFAMSAEATRYVLCSLFFVVGEDSAVMVSSDGRRLSLASCEAKNKKADCGEFIIPSKAVGEISRLVQSEGEIEIKYAESIASFNLKSEDFPVSIYTKLVDGGYPNYKQIIPKESKEKVILPRLELIGALKRAEVMTNEKMSSVKFTFTKNDLTISANTPEIGDASESIAVKYKGEEISIAFNPKYILDALNSLSDENVIFEMVDGISPIVLKIEGPFIYVVSPMRLS